MKKRRLLYILAAATLCMVWACVKDLEKEGINTTTKYIGTVVEKSTMKPIEGISVQVTDGSHVHAFSTTDRNGRFTLNDINFDQVGDDSYLWLDGTALDLPSKQEPLMGLGVEIYDYKTLILYDKTNADLLPKVTTDSIDGILALSAKASGKVTADGGHDIVSRGVCFATHQTPTIEDSIATAGTGLGDFTVTMPRLTKATTYFVRAFATNSIGTTYGAQKTFTTQNGGARMTTNAATGIEAKSATVSCRVSDDGGDAITRRGFVYATRQEPTLSDSTTTDGSDTGAFSHHLRNLANSTTYYYRPYATNACGTTYGPQKSFTTTSGLPKLTTTAISNITATSAKGGGNIIEDGGFRVTAHGLCWNTTGLPNISDAHTTNGYGTGAFSNNLTNLSRYTTYYVRAYATNSEGTAYGNEVTFITMDGRSGVTIEAATGITPTSAICNANVTSDGGLTVTERGLCWNTTGTPKINTDSKAAQGSGTGSFTRSMNNLTPGTTYHVRAYATTSYTTSYSREITFTTLSGQAALTVSSVTNITATSATSGGNITADGGAAITERGICWATSQNPTTASSHTALGSGTGAYTITMSGLTPSTTYYVRAYAINSVGTNYSSNQLSFTTSNGKPTVTTGSISSVTASSAVCGGNVTSDGGFTVTEKGLCWSTSQYPTVSNSHISSGNGTGSFNASLSGLTRSTTYYVRAYATNRYGTSYGSQVSFTTRDGKPTITTTSVRTAGCDVSFECNVTDDGGSPVTARGICYGSYPNPYLSAEYSHTENGTGKGYFTARFTFLKSSNIYYVRPYATNANGTTYGRQDTIRPYDTLPTFTYDGHLYRVAPVAQNTRMNWSAANVYCRNLNAYGYNDWRLPSESELLQMWFDRFSIKGFIELNYWSGTQLYGSSHQYLQYSTGLTFYCTDTYCQYAACPIRQEN